MKKTDRKTRFKSLAQDRLSALVGATIIWLILLSPGILLDLTYQGVLHCRIFMSVLDMARGLGKIGLHYNTMFSFLENNVGIIVTMITLFFTMSIHVDNRAEERVYGFSRSELDSLSRTVPYVVRSRHLNYLAPILMIVMTNLRYCLSGYLLLFWSYFFLMRQYSRYAGSFDKQRDIDAVVKKLTNCFADGLTSETLFEFQLTLEDFSNGIKAREEWKNAEKIYKELTSQKYEEVFYYIYGRYYFESVFSEKELQGNRKALQMLRKEITACDLRVAEKEAIEKEDRFLFWGILVGTIKCLCEEELLLFLEYFLAFHTRSNYTVERLNKGLPNPALSWQSAMLLTVVEVWLLQNDPENPELADKVNLLWRHGRSMTEPDCISIFDSFAELPDEVCQLFDDSVYQRALQNIKYDYRNSSRRSAAANLVASTGGETHE